MTKIVATSDLHGKLPSLPACDLLLIGGDLCPAGSAPDQAKWLDTRFRPWLHSLSAKEIVVIAGNHDQIFENAPHLVPNKMPWHYLQDSSITLFGITIYGTPWQLPFWGAFNLSDGRLSEVYKNIPHSVDIVLSHGPPFGIKDEVIKKTDSTSTVIHTGSSSLRKRILEVKPKFCLFGHIHDAYGIVEEEGITFANVSLVNDEMKIAHDPLVFDYLGKALI